MRLWLTRRRGERFQALEGVPLDGFEDIFEEELARQGIDIRLLVAAQGQEVRVKGIVLPSLKDLRKSGHVGTIRKRVEADLKELVAHLASQSSQIDSSRTASARDALAVLDALGRARRPLTAIVAV